MKRAFENTITVILVSVLIIVVAFIAVNTIITSNKEETQVPSYTVYIPSTATTRVETETTVEPTEVSAKEEIATISKTQSIIATETEEPTETTETTKATEPTTSPYATAATQASKASYQKQWDAGYLLALDYPDANYSCPHVELSE